MYTRDRQKKTALNTSSTIEQKGSLPPSHTRKAAQDSQRVVCHLAPLIRPLPLPQRSVGRVKSVVLHHVRKRLLPAVCSPGAKKHSPGSSNPVKRAAPTQPRPRHHLPPVSHPQDSRHPRTWCKPNDLPSRHATGPAPTCCAKAPILSVPNSSSAHSARWHTVVL